MVGLDPLLVKEKVLNAQAGAVQVQVLLRVLDGINGLHEYWGTSRQQPTGRKGK